MLLQNVNVELITIIAEDTPCDVNFANTLRAKINEQYSAMHQHSTSVKLYTLPLTKAGNTAITILLDIQRSYQSRRLYLMLTSVRITRIFIDTSMNLEMNQYHDIWITRHAEYNLAKMPSLLISFTELMFSELEPRTSMLSRVTDLQDYANVSSSDKQK